MRFIASQNAINSSKIIVFTKYDGDWLIQENEERFILDEDSSDYEETDNLFEVSEDWIYDRLPKLKGQLEQPDDTIIYANFENGEININQKHNHLILNYSARASRQANLDLYFFKWFRIHFEDFFVSLFFHTLFIALAIFIGWFFYILNILLIVYDIYTFLAIRDLFKSGDLNPAIVVDDENSLIAALTDLSLGIGSYPIIRIVKVKLPKKYRKNGTRLPIVGVYSKTKTEDNSYWTFYNCLPVPSGVKSEMIINEKINLIPPSEWLKLQKATKEIRSKRRIMEKYIPIDIETSSWKNINLKAIEWLYPLA